MKRFDFRRQLKGLDANSLESLKEYHLDLMLAFIGINQKEADKHMRYLSYIDCAINRLK